MKYVFLLFSIWLLIGCGPVQKEENSQALQIVSGKPVDKNRGVKFPQDHGAHLEQGIEWWYVTANLTAESGETFGAQWTLFRTQVPLPVESTWWDNQLYFAHFAMQHEQSHIAFERFARAKQANITASPFAATLDDWSLKSTAQSFLPLQMKAKQNGYAIDVLLSNSPRVLHGENGYSQKTDDGHASYYFSYPFLEVKGAVTFKCKKYLVSGNAWYDREWSASLLGKSQLGWDWFNLVSDDNPKQGLMLFCVRDAEQNYDYCSGTRISENNQATKIPRGNIKLEALKHLTIDGTKYPIQWAIKLPDAEPIIINALTKNSQNNLSVKYWEGRVTASGGFSGKGYAELSGY